MQSINEQTITVTPSTGNVTAYTDQSLHGRLLEVAYKSSNVGSLTITKSGTGEQVLQRVLASGTAWVVATPRKFSQSTTGSIANADHVEFALLEPLTVTVNTSGTAAGTTPVRIRYC